MPAQGAAGVPSLSVGTGNARSEELRLPPLPPPQSTPHIGAGARMLQRALNATRRSGTRTGLNVVAFSGGIDSSLVAALVHHEFPGRSLACIGLSAALPRSQLVLAREVAQHIGIHLRETATQVTHPLSPLVARLRPLVATG